MYFENLSQLIAMDGHGPYVWAVYVMALIMVLWLVISPLRIKRRFFIEEKARLRRETNRQDQ